MATRIIVQRKKDMIIVDGFNVYPSEVEGVLYAHRGRAHGRGHRRAGRVSRRGRQSLRRAARRRVFRSRNCARTARPTLRPTRCRVEIELREACRRARSARSSIACCGTSCRRSELSQHRSAKRHEERTKLRKNLKTQSCRAFCCSFVPPCPSRDFVSSLALALAAHFRDRLEVHFVRTIGEA